MLCGTLDMYIVPGSVVREDDWAAVLPYDENCEGVLFAWGPPGGGTPDNGYAVDVDVPDGWWWW